MNNDAAMHGDATETDLVGSDTLQSDITDSPNGPCRTDNDCSDGLFCNGAERCQPGAANADSRGCVAGDPPNPCLPGQLCDATMMRCVSSCSHTPDADGDGHRAADCGGDDCDDSDANRFPGNTEVCDAMNHDEDCDARSFGIRDGDMDMYADSQCCNADSMGTMHCGDDCNDSRANVHPALAETCDGLDNDCDGMIDEEVGLTFYPDNDHDGHGDGMAPATALMHGCIAPSGYALAGDDCDDAHDTVHPGAVEQCDADSVDENCDGTANPSTLCTCSGDITRMCATAQGVCMAGTERCVNGSWGLCSIGPTPEVCNGLDDNCNGTADEDISVTCYPDADNDGYAAAGATSRQTCPVPGRDGFAGCPPNQTNRSPIGVDIDCNDTDSTVSPGQNELCDPAMRDENCDGVSNPATQCNCTDGTTRTCMSTGSCGAGTQVCSAGQFGGCSIQPVAESCNGIDDDCDGSVDEALTIACYADNDNDGFAAMGAMALASCPVMGRAYVGGCPTGQTNVAPASASDCNDTNALINPSATELCDATSVDENCDGAPNPSSLCACSGSASRSCPLPGACAAGSQTCAGGSWGNCSIAPIAEICNGADDDCDGSADEGVTVTCYPDADNDGYAPSGASAIQSCPTSGREAFGGCPANQTNRAPSGSAIDCNDAVSTVNPGAAELCDGATPAVDENCDGTANPSSLCACSGSATRACVLPGACAAGTQTCASGAWGACSIGPVTEACNGVDDDCDGMTDEGLTVTCYADVDNDGFAATGATATPACPAPGRTLVGGCPNNTTNRAPSGASNADCNDGNASVNPSATEQCDGATPALDENCDGTANPSSLCACSGTASRSCTMAGLSGPCAMGTQTCASGSWQACTIQPTIEVCNTIDDDCDGTSDEGLTVTCFVDADNDGYAATGAASSQQCPIGGRESVGGCPTGYTNRAGSGANIDCADTNSSRNPGATEICNGADDNCNGMSDEGVAITYYRDADGDGFGTSVAGMTTSGCTAPTGYVSNNSDCNDTSIAIHPGASEVCNGADENCNGTIDEGVRNTYYVDADGDGYGSSAMGAMTQLACTAPSGYSPNRIDCDDTNAARNPSAPEVCDGVDNNCNGTTDEGAQTTYYIDADGDGYGSSAMGAMTRLACSLPSGYSPNRLDCNDGNAGSNPAAPEVCDTVDNNCNGTTDEGVQTTYYIDADGDGYGSSAMGAMTRVACTLPAGYAPNRIDCNDANASSNPGAPEVCDGIDNNCNAMIDEGVMQVYYRDADNDGFGNSAMPSTRTCGSNPGYVRVSGDCDDASASRNPGATETCDGIDTNCNGLLDGPNEDDDHDGYADNACAGAAGTDCNDARSDVHNGATEICDGVDSNCNGALDGPGEDDDADGHADVACAGAGGNDCNDTNNTIFVGATELCDGVDNNCDGVIAEDGDTDGHVAPTATCTGGPLPKDDCDDRNNRVYPGARELCDNVDNNCNFTIDDGADSQCTMTNAIGLCHQGQCATNCQYGFSDCNGLASDGCETSLLTDANNCGGCGIVCGAGGSCSGGLCSSIIGIAAGGNNASDTTCIVRASGTASCWGGNVNGELGIGNYTDQYVPTVPVMLAGIRQISIGGSHTCAVTNSNQLYCWGANLSGQLGLGATSVAYPTPQLVSLANVRMVAAGVEHTCAVTNGGAVYCWGRGLEGQLGDGGIANRPSPFLIASLSNVVEVAAGFQQSCARTMGQQAYCWGSGPGVGTGVNTLQTPTLVSSLSNVQQIASGYGHVCARISGGSVFCWGSNGSSQLGNGSTMDSNVPVNAGFFNNAIDLALGVAHSCAIRQFPPAVGSGSVHCWGSNDVGGGGPGAFPGPAAPNLSDAIDISSFGRHLCALRTTGEVDCWGQNFGGGLGNDTTNPSTLPVASIPIPVIAQLSTPDAQTCVRRASGLVQCFAGSSTPGNVPQATGVSDAVTIGDLCAVRASGAVLCWAYDRSHVTPIAGITNARQVWGDEFQGCARLATGGVQCWGANDVGQLGNGTTTNSATPVDVNAISTAVEIAVGRGGRHACARLTNNTVRCWGTNAGGALGDGSPADAAPHSTPVSASVSQAVQLVAGAQHSCVRLAAGTVSCWGSNAEGQLGNGSTVDSSGAVAVASISDARSISSTDRYNCVVRASGAVSCWGMNTSAQLGDGSFTRRLTPVASVGVTLASGVYASATHTCATLLDGHVACWGSNQYGEAGQTPGTMGGSSTYPTAVTAPLLP